MRKKIIISAIALAVISSFLFVVFSRNKNNQNLASSVSSPINKTTTAAKNQAQEQIILFYGDGCPHCATVEKYIAENNIEDKITMAKKEIYYNRSNAMELEEKVEACGLSSGFISVPFLWDGEECLVGVDQIINFFKRKI